MDGRGTVLVVVITVMTVGVVGVDSGGAVVESDTVDTQLLVKSLRLTLPNVLIAGRRVVVLCVVILHLHVFFVFLGGGGWGASLRINYPELVCQMKNYIMFGIFCTLLV